MKPIHFVLYACIAMSVSACGIETAGTAATSANLKKQELEEGRKSLDRVQYQIHQANTTASTRLEDYNLDSDSDE